MCKRYNSHKMRMAGAHLYCPDWRYRCAPGLVGHNVAEFGAFDPGHGQLFRWELVELFLLQRGKETLHSGIVIAAACAAHALDGIISGQHLRNSALVNWLSRLLCRIMPCAPCDRQVPSNARIKTKTSSFTMTSLGRITVRLS